MWNKIDNDTSQNLDVTDAAKASTQEISVSREEQQKN